MRTAKSLKTKAVKRKPGMIKRKEAKRILGASIKRLMRQEKKAKKEVSIIKMLRESVLGFLHARKDRVIIVECRDKYIIVAKRVKIVTTEIANSDGFQPVERITESFKMVLSIIAIHDDLHRMPVSNEPKNLVCRQLVKAGCPVIVIKKVQDIEEKLGE
jgi:hypothetical protein